MNLKSELESFRVIYLDIKRLCTLYVLCSMVQFKAVPNNFKFRSETKMPGIFEGTWKLNFHKMTPINEINHQRIFDFIILMMCDVAC